MSDSRLTRAGDTGGATTKTFAPSDHEAVTKAARGVPDRTASTLSFDAGTRTFTIAPVSGAWSYYIDGRRYVKNAAESIIIADTSGTHWIYYDGATLSEAVNPSHATADDLIINKVRVGLVYWNATDAAAYVVADERHGPVMTGASHHWTHDLIGSQWRFGFDLSGYVLNSDADADVAFEVADGTIYDEDLGHNIEDGAAANQYEQQLSGADAEIPILYRDNVTGAWTEDAASTLPYKHSGANRLAFNNDDGDGTWSQVEVDNNKFVLATLVATNDWQYPIKMVEGQAQYATLALALEGADTEQIAWGTYFPTPEVVILYRFVMQTNTGFGGTKNCKIIQITDLRRRSLTGGAVEPAQPHSILSATHPDSLAAAVTDGALIYGNATPEWAKHALVTLNAAGEMVGLTKLTVDNLVLDGSTISLTGGGSIILQPRPGSGIRTLLVGSVTVDRLAWFVENSAWGASMINTRTGLGFFQAYDGAGNLQEAGRMTIGTETNWGLAATQDAYMAFHTVLNGSLGERMRIISDGRVGINCDPLTHPGASVNDFLLLHREGAGINMSAIVETSSAGGHRPLFFFRRARGTADTPVPVDDGDFIGSFVAAGHDGNVYRNAGGIEFVMDGDASAGVVPISIWMRTGTSSRTTRMTFQSDGDILVDPDSKMMFRDSDIYLWSPVDGVAELAADSAVAITTPGLSLDAASIVIPTDNGITYVPGADIDTDLITVTVTGAPKFLWDESMDVFNLTHGLQLIERGGDPAEPAAGSAALYLKQSGGKTTFCIRFNNGGGAADVVEIAQEN